jgi:hypothetical protein
LKWKIIIISFSLFLCQSSYSLDVYKTGIDLSSSLGDTYCQNLIKNNTSDWRMPSINEILELIDQGVILETTHCSNTIKPHTSLIFYKCLNQDGRLIIEYDSTPHELMCVRGESNFSETASVDNCPAASFSMSGGILHIPLLNVPNLLGKIEKYNVNLKLISDDLMFEFLNATKVE